MPVLKDQVAVVTGGSSGVGQAIAQALGAEGVTVCIAGRTAERLEASAQRMQATGCRVLPYRVDLSEDGQILEFVRSLQDRFGQIDIIVHSAGIVSFGRVREAAIEHFDHQYRVNVRAAYQLTQQILPMMRALCGQIVFINSSAGMNARGNVGQYAATKHALKAVADSLREEENTNGLRVLSVFLGRTATPMQADIHRWEGRPYDPHRLVQPDDVATMVISALKLPWTAEVTDISIRPREKS